MSSRRHLAPLVLVPLIAVALLWLFAWPAARVAPRGLPVGVTGTDSAVVDLAGGLAVHAGSTSFDLRRYDDEGSARRAVEQRHIYGAVVMTPAGTTLLTASAASPAVATLLREAAVRPSGAHAGPVKVVDVVPLPAADPRGIAFSSLLLPLLVASTVGAVLVSRLARTPGRRAVLLAGAAALTGVAATALAQSWLEFLRGNWGANAGVVALTALAVSSVVAGLTALGRTAGLTCGAVLMVLVGNATSGVSTAPELLPRAVAWTGRLLPPGAGSHALRGTAFFDGNAIGRDLAVLAGWSLLGLAMVAWGARRAAAHAA